MERIYFSKQNFSIIYNILRKKIMNSSNYDITTTESFHKELVNVMKTIYANKNSQQFNIPSNLSDIDTSRYLSQKCINIALPYFEDNIKKTQSQSGPSREPDNKTLQMNRLERDMSTGLNSQINRLSDRPSANTRMNNDNSPDVNSQYDQIMKARQPVQQNLPNPVNFQAVKQQESNDDVQSRYSQLTAMRENEYTQQPPSQPAQTNTNSFQHPSTNINQQFQSGNASEMSNNINMTIRDKNRDGYPNPTNQFNSFPQNNPNEIGANLNNNPFGSNVQAPTNSLESQFGNITNTDQPINTNIQPDVSESINMVPDNVDYDQLMKQFEMPNPISSDTPTEYDGVNSMNDQFQTSIVNSQKIREENVVPESQVVNSDLKALEKVPKVNNVDNTEYTLLKEILQNQQVNLDDTNRRINDLVTIMEKQDLGTFYETMVNMPSLIAKQSDEQFQFRKHNLVISSRDRKLDNDSFNKYNFRVEFGVEGSQTISTDRRPTQTSRVLISNNLLSADINSGDGGASTNKIDFTNNNLTTSGEGQNIELEVIIDAGNNITNINVLEVGSGFKVGDTITLGVGLNYINSTVTYTLIENNFEPISSNAITNVPRTFVSPGAANPNLVDVLKNVVEIKLKRVIIPRPRDAVYYPDPYYFVCIEEFDSNVITTKRLSDKVFCKIHFDKEVVFGGIGNEATTDTGDDGRKYLYYKNDDGDKKAFYNAPLASLDRLSIKILDSRGRDLGDVWGDKDTTKNGTPGTPGTIVANFYNNTFIKDELLNTSNNVDGRVSSITSTTVTTKKNGADNTSTVVPLDKLIVNLTNQIEYVFEVTTKEKDLDGIFKAENL